MAARTRVKICGLTRTGDVAVACVAGADAVGFVCFQGSPRHVPRSALAELAHAVAPFVTPVLLFVDAAPEDIRRALEIVPNALLQFHGAESPADCQAYGRPYLRALAVGEGADLLDCERRFPAAAAMLVDTPPGGDGRNRGGDRPGGFGGAGIAFDWRRLPGAAARGRPLVLAGGLTAANVGGAIATVRPWAVDVSSGVEERKGVKDPARIRDFIAAVRAADADRTEP